MRVQFTETVDAPTHRFEAGAEYNLPPELLQPHVDAGRAVVVIERAIEPPVESPEKPRRRRPKNA